MSGADRPGVSKALVARSLRPQRVEDRHQPGDVGGRAAGHQSVAVLEPPDTAGNPAVDVPDAIFAQHSALTGSSVQRELPPSMTTSPGARRVASSATVDLVGLPAGIINQTARGAVSEATRSGRLSTSRVPGLRV